MLESILDFARIFNVFSQISHIIAPYYHILIIGLIFIAVIVVLILLFFLFKVIRRNLKKIKKPKILPIDEDAENIVLSAQEKKEKSGFYQFRKRLGFVSEVSTDELARSFEQMKLIIEEMVGGSDPLYKTPLYLVVGGEGSGKKSILDHVGLGSPFELDMMNYKIQEMKKYWWFYDQGIILKAPGSSILSKESGQSNISLWRHLLSLLERYRPNRPLDGIILTIPCDELIGKNKLDLSLIQERARTLYTKLLQLQTSCGISVPVYVVVTKTDAIFGFESFCREVPGESLNEIFGWSSPYGTHQTYSPDWLKDAFHQIEARLQRVSLEIYTENSTVLEADGLYVFSTSFRDIQNTLSIYLSEIFKTSNLHDPMMFRGIYFTGDATIPEYENMKNREKNIKNIPRPDRFSNEQQLRLYFLKELFSNKIFLESSLARGTHRSIKHGKKTLNTAQVVLIALVMAGTIDTLFLYYGMKSKTGSLLHSLSKIETMLLEAENLSLKAQTGFNKEKFESQGKFLIDFINTYENTRFASPFIPSTWFSGASSKIESVLAIAFDHLVLRSLSLDLKLKAEKVIQGISPESIAEETKSPGLSQSKQFIILKTFVKDIEDFEKAVGKYNDFARTKDRVYLEPVVSYLFGTTIPKVFFEHIAGQMSETLKWEEYVPIELEVFQNSVTYYFEQLMTQYIDSVFGGENYAVAKFFVLENSLDQLGGRQGTSTASISEIQQLESKANEVVAAIEHSDFKWLNKTKLEFNTDLEQLVGKMNNLKLLGKNFGDEFKKRTFDAFIRFKRDLPDIGLNLTGSIFALEKGVSVAAPSESFQKLQKSLAELSKEPFMLKTEAKKNITPPPPGRIVTWDIKDLQHASNLITSYDQFIQNKLSNYPAQLQSIVQSVSLRALQINVMNLVIKSMIMDVPPIAPSDGTPEEAIKPIMENLKLATPYITRIIPMINGDSVGNNFMMLQSIIVNQYYDTLGTLDAILEKDGIYKIKNGNFDWWEGEEMVNAKAFNASDVTDLKNRLKIQATRIEFLVKEFGIPLLTILKTQGLKINQLSFPLLAKWTRILDNSAGYEKQKPDSTMLMLENYIVEDLTPITGKNCVEKLKKEGTGTVSGDFFTASQQSISKKIYDRCYLLKMKSSIKDYTAIVDFFNSKISEKFPFSDEDSAPDAKVEDIQKLYKLFEHAGGATDKIISSLPEDETSLPQIKIFLKSIEELKPIFVGFIEEKPILKDPTYMVTVNFRANKSQEIGGSNIVDWFLSIGKNTVSSRSKEKKIAWTYGDAVMFSLKWADGGSLKPAYDSAQEGMAVEDRLAGFTVPSKWSLLKAVRMFGASSGELGAGVDSEPHMLKFTVPTLIVPPTTVLSDNKNAVQGKPGETAKVYLRLEIATSQKVGGETIALPTFPSKAPALSEETKAIAIAPKTIKPKQPES